MNNLKTSKKIVSNPFSKVVVNISLLTFSFIISFLLIIFFWKETYVFFNASILFLAVLFYLTTCFLVWYYVHQTTQEKENEFKLNEMELKKEKEDVLAKQNLEYRMESMKWEKTYQVVKLVTEQKKPDDKKKEEEKDLLNVPVAKSLIAAIKSIRDEFDNIEQKK